MIDKESKLSLRFLLCSLLIILQNRLQNHHQLVKQRHLQSLERVESARKNTPPTNSSDSPNRPIGVLRKSYPHVE